MKIPMVVEDREIAWHTTQSFLTILGFVLGVAFLATMQWWLQIGALGGAMFVWFMLYRLELAWRARQDLLYRADRRIETHSIGE